MADGERDARMDGYDQLWSLIEADGADGVPGLIDDARSSAAEHAPITDLQVDVSALEGLTADSGAQSAVLAGSWSAEDDFFPIHAPAAFAGSALPGVTPSTGDTPLVLPATPDGVEVPEPLVLPGVMSDDFLIDKDAGQPLVLPGEPDTGDILYSDEPLLGHWTRGGHQPLELPVDHTVHVDDHGLIGAHGADDWLL